jgi:RimJ/RimL family protein N-acetyltransferase
VAGRHGGGAGGDGAVRVVDLFDASEAELVAWHELDAANQRAREPDVEPWPLSYAKAEFFTRDDNWKTGGWVALDDAGRALAWSFFWASTRDNLHRLDGLVEADPDRPDESAVHALLREWLPAADRLGRTVLGMEVAEGSPMVPVLDEVGFTIGMRDECNVVDLSEVDVAALRTYLAAARMRAGAAGYDLMEWDAPTPEEWLDRYVAALDAMNDAPRENLSLGRFEMSAERHRVFEASVARQGRTLRIAAAVHRDSGEVAALTELVHAPDRPWRLVQENTAVTPAHRGHGLGWLVKAANLDWVLREHPDARDVMTWNAVSNEHMIAVNRRLGFRCRLVFQEREAPLETVAARLSATT